MKIWPVCIIIAVLVLIMGLKAAVDDTFLMRVYKTAEQQSGIPARVWEYSNNSYSYELYE